jgi:hypothetical protein
MVGYPQAQTHFVEFKPESIVYGRCVAAAINDRWVLQPDLILFLINLY